MYGNRMGTRDDARRFLLPWAHHHAWLKGPLLVTAPIKFTQSPTYVAYHLAHTPRAPHICLLSKVRRIVLRSRSDVTTDTACPCVRLSQLIFTGK